MKHLKHLKHVAAMIVVALTTCACGTPMLDTSSVPAFVASTEEIKESLKPEQLALFEDAFDYLTDNAELTSDAKYLEPVLDTCARLNGMTAEQIIIEAWQIRVVIVEDRLKALETLRHATASSRELLQGLEILEARLFPIDTNFLERPVVEIELQNHTRQRVYRASFRASLRHRDELEPWVVETVDRPFGSGLSPRMKTTIRLELGTKDWRRISEAGPNGIFACDVVRIEGRRNRIIASSDFSSIDEYLLGALKQRLEELQATKPLS